MTPAAPRPERLALRLLTAADSAANRVYSQRFNPLYQSGTIVVALYLLLIVTGVWEPQSPGMPPRTSDSGGTPA